MNIREIHQGKVVRMSDQHPFVYVCHRGVNLANANLEKPKEAKRPEAGKSRSPNKDEICSGCASCQAAATELVVELIFQTTCSHKGYDGDLVKAELLPISNTRQTMVRTWYPSSLSTVWFFPCLAGGIYTTHTHTHTHRHMHTLMPIQHLQFGPQALVIQEVRVVAAACTLLCTKT